jgi:hypothetical protein
MMRLIIFASLALLAVVLLLMFGCSSLERKLLFYPTHDAGSNGLSPWTGSAGTIIGYARIVPAPKNIWLMLHGNAGQASDRAYALPSFSPEDSVFILEYPGYGRRPGAPSRESFNAAAREAYLLLRKTYPAQPLCVVGESIGSGPACALATSDPAPAKIVLLTPFARLSAVARDHFPSWLVAVALRSDWDNTEALARYRGPVEIFAAAADNIIPIGHARTLASAVPASKLVVIEGGHNEWSTAGRVRIRNP